MLKDPAIRASLKLTVAALVWLAIATSLASCAGAQSRSLTDQMPAFVMPSAAQTPGPTN